MSITLRPPEQRHPDHHHREQRDQQQDQAKRLPAGAFHVGVSMTDVSHSHGRATNPVGAETGLNFPGSGNIQRDLVRLLRALFPIKTWGKLSEILGLSERVAKHRLAGSREFTADELAALLRSDHGIHVLTALMGSHRPRWWRDIKRAGDLAQLRRDQEAQRRLIERLEREAGD